MPDEPSSRYQQVESLYQQAIDLAPDSRGAFLRDACGEDDGLRREIETLLAHYERASSDFLDRPAHDLGALVDEPTIPERIGDYAIVALLGRGGMGSVYEAEQAQPQRSVALKVIRADGVGERMIRRFRQEADVLGRLQHPGIAQIYAFDVGDVVIDGIPTQRRPFFAMERVAGETLTEFARRRALDRPARLKLFALICDAVEHAHQKGVIHRDLKPANILVTSDGQPKVLDFGVARLTEGDVQMTTLQTDGPSLIGTLPYMSPEQVGGDSAQLDTRSDVYALGVMLYEMVAGQLPYDLGGLTIAAAARVIAEQAPTALRTTSRGVDRDLETIVGKALEKDPARRYGSVGELAADVRRLLRNEPIVARPASVLYQFRKFAQRNTALVGAAATVFLVLVAAVAWTTIAMLQVQEASRETAAINDFMRDMLVAGNTETREADTRFADVLREAAGDAPARFADYPLLEADVRKLLGDAFRSLSLYTDGAAQLKQAFEIRERVLGPTHTETLRAAAESASMLQQLMRYDDAEKYARIVLDRTPEDRRDDVIALIARCVLAMIEAFRGDLDAAIADQRAIIADARRNLGDHHFNTAYAEMDLAETLHSRVIRSLSDDPPRDLDEAVAAAADALDGLEALFGEDGRGTLYCMVLLAKIRATQREFAIATDWAERAIELAVPRFGAEHEICFRAHCVLSEARFEVGQYAEAAASLKRAIELARKRTFGDGIETLSWMTDGLPILDAAGDYATGEEYARILFERFGGNNAHAGAMAVRFRVALARFVSRQGRLDEAEQLLAEMPPVDPEMLPEAYLTDTDLVVGGILVSRGEYDVAERRLRAGLDRAGPREWVRVPLQQELDRLTRLRGAGE